MGGIFSAPKAPPPPPPPPPAPTKSDAEVRDAEQAERRRRAAAQGRQSTILTMGLNPAANQQAAEGGQMGGKTLLGQ